ncbi:MAG TPA: 16S rRNA (cytosine(1402)-N(4))-methyltransferase RsmH [Longilinea sp.]|nr:16S rRNA (cytosine(1402)-N(4))-methyltransferase RsmH [Longilinea sp.]
MMASSAGNPPHLPVLYKEIIHALRPHSPGHYVDGTVGAGGHAGGILQDSSPAGRLLGLDLDPQALALAGRHLQAFSERVVLRQASYTQMKAILKDLAWPLVDGIVLDLGVSSMQIDNPERGFSFQAEGPLDMRFGPQVQRTAADLVNGLPERELSDLIWQYGEERFSRRIAHAIVQSRPLLTTNQLAEVIANAVGVRHSPIHPATRSFQALRIAVNGELEGLERTLPQAIDCLAPGGRIAVISFHSLEDRIVKQYFRRESVDCICPPEQPVCTCGHKATITEITRKPVEAAKDEIDNNPRARSARLRIAEKKMA